MDIPVGDGNRRNIPPPYDELPRSFHHEHPHTGVSGADYLDAARDVLISMDHRGVPVLDEDRLVGILTGRTSSRESPQADPRGPQRAIQAVDGAENAEICEIVDHHASVPLRPYADLRLRQTGWQHLHAGLPAVFDKRHSPGQDNRGPAPGGHPFRYRDT